MYDACFFACIDTLKVSLAWFCRRVIGWNVSAITLRWPLSRSSSACRTRVWGSTKFSSLKLLGPFCGPCFVVGPTGNLFVLFFSLCFVLCNAAGLVRSWLSPNVYFFYLLGKKMEIYLYWSMGSHFKLLKWIVFDFCSSGLYFLWALMLVMSVHLKHPRQSVFGYLYGILWLWCRMLSNGTCMVCSFAMQRPLAILCTVWNECQWQTQK